MQGLILFLFYCSENQTLIIRLIGSRRYNFITQTLFPVVDSAYFILICLAKPHHFDTVLSLNLYGFKAGVPKLYPIPLIRNNHLCASIAKLANATCSSSFKLFAWSKANFIASFSSVDNFRFPLSKKYFDNSFH